jgi:hypothetical protein
MTMTPEQIKEAADAICNSRSPVPDPEPDTKIRRVDVDAKLAEVKDKHDDWYGGL